MTMVLIAVGLAIGVAEISVCEYQLRNIGFPNGPVFRYGNFFIPRG